MKLYLRVPQENYSEQNYQKYTQIIIFICHSESTIKEILCIINYPKNMSDNHLFSVRERNINLEKHFLCVYILYILM